MAHSTPFYHCYHCGSSQLMDRSWRQRQCSACGRQQYLSPTPAAVALVVDAQLRLLLMRRAHQPGLGQLGLPGGIIEPWETAEQACSRELQEETGLPLPSSAWRYLGTYCNRYDYQGFTWPTLDLMFYAQLPEITLGNSTDGEAQELILLPLHQVVAEELAFPTHTAAVRDLRQKLATAAG